MKLAVVFIGTNKYLNFLPSWYKACEKFLAPKTEKQYFVFTDGEIEGMPENVNAFSQEHLPWPYITLKRWNTILKASTPLEQFDYVLFLDADMRIVSEVSEEDLFTNKKFIGVHHPCHALGMHPHTQFPGAFETNPQSLASITEEDDVSTYWQGCLWGGRVPYVIDMIRELDRRTMNDLDRDVIAVWHDESQMNKFFIENKEDVHTLGPQYAYPECFSDHCEFDSVIVHLAKDNSKYQV
tara:strand:- start:11874 stop:12590 length:717 start_codon:yes stop_codon:yes gene_type:complete